MGQVEGGIGGGGGDVQETARLEQLPIGQAPILPPEHQRRFLPCRASLPCRWRLRRQQPGQRIPRRAQGQGGSLQATGGGHHAAAIGQRGGQIGEDHRPLQMADAMHRHLTRFPTERITAGGHQTQLIDGEIGAQAGHAAHIAGAKRLHQHQVHAQGRLCRKASKSAIVCGSGWKRGMGGVRPLTTC